MKRTLIILGVLLGSLGTNHLSSLAFSDVQVDSLDFMYEQRIIDGYPDGTFGYAQEINRAELIKMAFTAAQIELSNEDKNCFTDVLEDEWYVPYVCTAKKEGIVSGYPDGSFKPEYETNKVEAFKILVNTLNLEASTDPADPVAHEFNDVKESDWFYSFVNILSDNYYIDWTSDLNPEQFITRGEVAEVIFRTLLSAKLYGPIRAQGWYGMDYPSVELSNADALALAARDFFRVPPLIKNVSYQQLLDEQKAVDEKYEWAKQQYSDSTFIDPEEWNYSVLKQTSDGTYGVIEIWDQDRELPPIHRWLWHTWAVVKFDADQKLVAYDFFTRSVDRPKIEPNIFSLNGDMVEISLGTSDSNVGLNKDGEKVYIKLVNFR